MKFNELQINENILRSIEELGYTEATQIQERSINLILEKKDIIGQAQTGTGKTAAFGIPLIQMSHTDNTAIEHLIITPTRELANQIQKELEVLAKYSKIKIGYIVGGRDYNIEKRMLKNNPNIIIATPGRLLDYITNKKIDLNGIKSLTLDEADEMLSIGFKQELDAIIEAIPNDRQTLLFSATLNKGVKDLAEKSLHEPVEILLSSGLQATSTVEQFAILVSETEKFSLLTKLLELSKPESAIIFGRTKRRVDELTNALIECGFEAKAIHGDMTLRERTTVMEGFKAKKFPLLVATDVASRGLHIENVEIVYNFDIPQEIEYYVHRIGRTGRVGNKGQSYTFLRKCETNQLFLIEKITQSKIKLIEEPTKTQINDSKYSKLNEQFERTSQNKKIYTHIPYAEELIEKYGANNIIAMCVDLLLPQNDIKNISLTEEPPAKAKYQLLNQYRKEERKTANSSSTRRRTRKSNDDTKLDYTHSDKDENQSNENRSRRRSSSERMKRDDSKASEKKSYRSRRMEENRNRDDKKRSDKQRSDKKNYVSDKERKFDSKDRKTSRDKKFNHSSRNSESRSSKERSYSKKY